ncbi:hypothetical protein ALC53_04652 [Atta colombica]|uniref:Uncharacterized protein n=1 Tax=Atta colombica TaxID=520822 RepID=A0A195BKW0_9HYME|nr:hypothetical protein ALC53_04652 [Atta colombica]
MEKGWKGRLRILTGQVTYSMPYNNRIEVLVYRLFHTHSIGEQVSGNSLRNYDTTNQEFIGKVCARFEQFLKRHFHRNYSLGKIASRVSSRITVTRSLVRSEKGVTFKSMHETAAISDTVPYDAENRFEKSEYITTQPYIKYVYFKIYTSIYNRSISFARYHIKNRLTIFRIAAGSLSLLEISNPLSKLRADFLPFSRRGKLLISLQPGTNGGIIAIHSIRVGALNVKAYGNRSASVKRMVVASGASEAPHVRTPGTRRSARRGGGDAGAGTCGGGDGGGGDGGGVGDVSEHDGGGSSGAGGGSSDNTYNEERSM